MSLHCRHGNESKAKQASARRSRMAASLEEAAGSSGMGGF